MSVRSRDLFLCAALLFAPLAVADSPKPGIDPRMDTLLRDMGDYLKAVSEVRFRTEVSYDRVLESGQKILYGRQADFRSLYPTEV